jgi:hypothetical protein
MEVAKEKKVEWRKERLERKKEKGPCKSMASNAHN